MTVFAEIVVVASGVFLIAMASAMLVAPAVTERFVLSFASSARAHYTEMFFRLLFGASLVLLSHTMWQARLFFVLGSVIVISSAVLLAMPWRWHHRLGTRVLPILVRYMRIYAFGVFAFGALLLYAVFATDLR